ncbi:MAG TPA: TIGR03936 family radical SAM-associated protein [Dictyoglomaceae bacterium]|nr:TIGR03936 family radical SAM-associated protein [Dictyoglomaceae bacterium]HOL38846.1 TIGR03936 family radical SAM-associated protein [Dictyoglomaceae bacterium]HOP95373.1 TIGR03936 family radical SAM-associated protein [Dictyoglomaceae bacterium]HPP15737.1 TIGR03936 family radical SAM-associated protein [Dictyoglomaceae bacterium]
MSGEFLAIIAVLFMDKFIYRLAFYKKELLKYVSSNDLLSFLIRALRRSYLPICYSQGFNPKPLISFGLPCPVGVESEQDWIDITLGKEMEKNEIMESLNSQLPKSLQFFRCERKYTNSSLISDTYGINYELKVFALIKEKLLEEVAEFKNKENVMILVRRGSKIKEINIKSFIEDMELKEIETGYFIVSLKTKKIGDSIIRGEEFLEIFSSKPLLLDQKREVVLNCINY